MVQIPFFSSHWEAEGKVSLQTPKVGKAGRRKHPLTVTLFFSIRPQHALVTGGSQGLGLALATELVRRGADVTIVARTVSKLEKAVADISVSPHQV